MRKKLLGIVLCVVLLVALVGSVQGAAKKYRIYLITMDQMDQHWVNVDAGARKAVQELGNVEYRWLAPDVKDDAKQIECINNAVAGGADAILLAANGPTAVTSALREATAAGVKIIYVDSPADYPGEQTLATDNEAAGYKAGQEMKKALVNKGLPPENWDCRCNAATASVVAREKVSGKPLKEPNLKFSRPNTAKATLPVRKILPTTSPRCGRSSGPMKVAPSGRGTPLKRPAEGHRHRL